MAREGAAADMPRTVAERRDQDKLCREKIGYHPPSSRGGEADGAIQGHRLLVDCFAVGSQ
jgi:hypothetical protein